MINVDDETKLFVSYFQNKRITDELFAKTSRLSAALAIYLFHRLFPASVTYLPTGEAEELLKGAITIPFFFSFFLFPFFFFFLSFPFSLFSYFLVTAMTIVACLVCPKPTRLTWRQLKSTFAENTIISPSRASLGAAGAAGAAQAYMSGQPIYATNE
jgi:hypothetical protein